MPRGRGHRGNLEEQGRELNIVPYLDIMVNLVMFMLISITSFVSFTVLNTSIPQLAPDSGKAAASLKKAQLLLMVRVNKKDFSVDPSVQGGKAMRRTSIKKTKDGTYDFEALQTVAQSIKDRFKDETRVLIIAHPQIIYDDLIKTMDALRETVPGDPKTALFPDVTLSIL